MGAGEAGGLPWGEYCLKEPRGRGWGCVSPHHWYLIWFFNLTAKGPILVHLFTPTFHSVHLILHCPFPFSVLSILSRWVDGCI